MARSCRRLDARQPERVAEIGGQQQRQRARAALLGAAVGILDEIARALAETDERGRRQIDVQAAERRHDARRAASGARRRVGVASSASPIADTVSGETSTSTGMTSSNASVSPASFTVIRTRARPIARPAASKRTSTDPPAAHVDRLRRRVGELHDVGIEALDRHRRRPAGLQLARDDRAERRLVADREEARERRLERDRLVDPDLAVGGAEPRPCDRRRPP